MSKLKVETHLSLLIIEKLNYGKSRGKSNNDEKSNENGVPHSWGPREESRAERADYSAHTLLSLPTYLLSHSSRYHVFESLSLRLESTCRRPDRGSRDHRPRWRLYQPLWPPRPEKSRVLGAARLIPMCFVSESKNTQATTATSARGKPSRASFQQAHRLQSTTPLSWRSTRWRTFCASIGASRPPEHVPPVLDPCGLSDRSSETRLAAHRIIKVRLAALFVHPVHSSSKSSFSADLITWHRFGYVGRCDRPSGHG